MINIKSSRKHKKAITADKFNMNTIYDDLYKRGLKGQNFNNILKYIISDEKIK